MERIYGDIPTYLWKELAGKLLEIVVISDGEYTGLYGKDLETGDLYVLTEEINR